MILWKTDRLLPPIILLLILICSTHARSQGHQFLASTSGSAIYLDATQSQFKNIVDGLPSSGDKTSLLLPFMTKWQKLYGRVNTGHHGAFNFLVLGQASGGKVSDRAIQQGQLSEAGAPTRGFDGGVDKPSTNRLSTKDILGLSIVVVLLILLAIGLHSQAEADKYKERGPYEFHVEREISFQSDLPSAKASFAIRLSVNFSIWHCSKCDPNLLIEKMAKAAAEAVDDFGGKIRNGRPLEQSTTIQKCVLQTILNLTIADSRHLMKVGKMTVRLESPGEANKSLMQIHKEVQARNAERDARIRAQREHELSMKPRKVWEVETSSRREYSPDGTRHWYTQVWFYPETGETRTFYNVEVFEEDYEYDDYY